MSKSYTDQEHLNALMRPSVFEEVTKQQNQLNALMRPSVFEGLAKQQNQLNALMRPSVFEEVTKQQNQLNAVMQPSVFEGLAKQQNQLNALMRPSVFEEVTKQQNHLKALMQPSVFSGSAAPRVETQEAIYPLNSKTEGLFSVSDLGRLIRQTRKQMALTQQQFADMTGVGRRFISELEAGKPTLEFGRVLKVCQAAGIELMATKR